MSEPARPVCRWMFHASAVVRDYDAALAWLGRVCGARALEYSDMSDDPLVGRRGGVIWLGDGGIELIEPRHPESGAMRFLERVGSGMYGLAVQVDDVSAAARWFRAGGRDAVGEPERGYIFTRPSQTAGLHLEWSSLAAAWDPHFGGDVPAGPAPAIHVPRIAWVGALCEDVADTAATLDELCRFSHLPAPAPAEACLSLGDCVLRLSPKESASALQELDEAAYGRARVHCLALRVASLAAAEDVLTGDGVRLLDRDAEAGWLLTDPRDTFGIPLVWTERDAHGDPRGPLPA